MEVEEAAPAAQRPVAMENSSHPTVSPSNETIPSDHNHIPLPHPSNSNGGGETQHNFSVEEVKGALETIASTGKFWHDWDELKAMLFFQLKQVLSSYPEATVGDDQQKSSLGESYSELVKRLEEGLLRFTKGPPFTLQRLCEILLAAQTIYPKLSKLALALEKNLLVTSTLTRSTDTYPTSIVQPEEQFKDVPAPPQFQPQVSEPEQPPPQPLETEQAPPHPQLLETGQPQAPLLETEQPQALLLETEQPQAPLLETEQPQAPVLETDQLQPQLPETEQLQPQLPETEQPQPQLPETEQPQPQPLLPEPEQPQPLLHEPEQSHPLTGPVENGGELMTENKDVVMADAEAEVDDSMTIDMETFDEIVSSSETNPEPVNNS